jgi:hypothetical protein
MGEGFAQVERGLARAHRKAVGEMERSAAPQPPLAAVQIEGPDPGAGLAGGVAVGHEHPAEGAVDHGEVRIAQAFGAVAGKPAAAEVEPEQRGMAQVAGEERAVGIEGHAEDEAAGRGDPLDRRSVRRDPAKIAVLIAAPDPAVGTDGHAFGMA